MLKFRIVQSDENKFHVQYKWNLFSKWKYEEAMGRYHEEPVEFFSKGLAEDFIKEERARHEKLRLERLRKSQFPRYYKEP